MIAAGTRRLVGGLFECADLGAHRGEGLCRAGAGVAGARRRRARRAGSRRLRARRWRRWSGARRRSSCCCGAGSRPRAARARWCCSRASRASASRGCSRPLQERIAARAAHAPALLLLAAPPGQRAAPDHRAARARGRIRARRPARDASSTSWRRLLAPTSPPDRGRGAAGRAAVAADRRPLPAAEPHPAAQAGADLRGAAAAARSGWLGGDPVLMIFEDVHWIDPTSRELLDLSSSAWRACRSCCHHLPPRVPAALDRPAARDHADAQPARPARGCGAGAADRGRAAPARRAGGRDRRARGRRAAVRRGADQGGSRRERSRRPARRRCSALAHAGGPGHAPRPR